MASALPLINPGTQQMKLTFTKSIVLRPSRRVLQVQLRDIPSKPLR
ncbi:MAG TPA: hypothetical protein VL284_20225 [Thermoanaerobaculia bacterium]|nr:hypothetical protein [Thermoanaerobaculia bacterium]